MDLSELNTKAWVVKSPKLIAQMGLGVYLGFIIYASLYPFHPWHASTQSITYLLIYGWTDKTYFFDVLQNLLFYLPLGALWGTLFQSRWRSIFTLILFAFSLSTMLEIAQSFLPQRCPSILDITLNVSGVLVGFYGFKKMTTNSIEAIFFGMKPITLQAAVGFLFLSLFVAAQWFPFIPTFEPSHLSNAVRLFYTSLIDASLFQPFTMLRYFLWGNLTLLGTRLLFEPSHYLKYWQFLVIVVLFGKLLFVTRVLTLDMLLGIAFSGVTVWIFLTKHEI